MPIITISIQLMKGPNTPVNAHVIFVGSQKQTITPTAVLVGGRNVYIYPSGAVLVKSV